MRNVVIGLCLVALLALNACAVGKARLGTVRFGGVEVSGYLDPAAGIGMGTVVEEGSGNKLAGASVEIDAPGIVAAVAQWIIGLIPGVGAE